MDYNLLKSDGAHVGLNDDSTVAPGASKTYLWYAGDIVTNEKGTRIVGIPMSLEPSACRIWEMSSNMCPTGRSAPLSSRNARAGETVPSTGNAKRW